MLNSATIRKSENRSVMRAFDKSVSSKEGLTSDQYNLINNNK